MQSCFAEEAYLRASKFGTCLGKDCNGVDRKKKIIYKGWHVGTNNTDPCVFVILSPDNTFSVMWIHTDDCFVRDERDEDLEYIRN